MKDNKFNYELIDEFINDEIEHTENGILNYLNAAARGEIMLIHTSTDILMQKLELLEKYKQLVDKRRQADV